MAFRPHQDYGGPSTSRPSTGSSANQMSLSPSNSFGSFVGVRPRASQLRRRSQSVTAPISIAKSEAQKDRVPMACTHCRSRKVRCDGAQPQCGLCGRLGRVCSYAKVSESENVALRARKRALRERRAKEADMNRGWAAEALQGAQMDAYPDVWPPGMATAPAIHPHHPQHHHPGGSALGGFAGFPGPAPSMGLSSPPFEPVSHDGPLTSPYSAPDPSHPAHPDSPISARRVGPSPYPPRMSAPSRRSPPERPSWLLSQLNNEGRGDGSSSHLKSAPTSASVRPSIAGQMSTSTLPPGPSSFDDAGGPKGSGGNSSHGLRQAFGPSGSGLSEIPPYGQPPPTNATAGGTNPSSMAFAGSAGIAPFTGPGSWQHQQPSGLALPETFSMPVSGPAWSASVSGPPLTSTASSESSPVETRVTSHLGPWRSRAQTYDHPHPPPFIGALEHASIMEGGTSSVRESVHGGGGGMPRGISSTLDRGPGGGLSLSTLPPPQLPERASAGSILDQAQSHSQSQSQSQSQSHQVHPHFQHPHQPAPPLPPQQLQPSPSQHHAYSQHPSHHSRHGVSGHSSQGSVMSSYAFANGPQSHPQHPPHHQHHHHHHQHPFQGQQQHPQQSQQGGGSNFSSGYQPQQH